MRDYGAQYYWMGSKSVSDAIAKQSSIIGHIDYKSYLDPNREKLALLLENLTTSKLKYTFFVGGSGGSMRSIN